MELTCAYCGQPLLNASQHVDPLRDVHRILVSVERDFVKPYKDFQNHKNQSWRIPE